MPESYLIFAAFSAYTAILVALGYLAGRLRADYRMMRTLARRTVETRLTEAEEREAKVVQLTAQLNVAREAFEASRKALERERAELAIAKGMVA